MGRRAQVGIEGTAHRRSHPRLVRGFVDGENKYADSAKIVLAEYAVSANVSPLPVSDANPKPTTKMKRLKKITSSLAAYEGKPVSVMDESSHAVRFVMDKQDGNFRQVTLFRRNSSDSNPVQMQLGSHEEVHHYEEQILPKSLVAAMEAHPLAAKLLASWREQKPARKVKGNKEFAVDSYSLVDLSVEPSAPRRWTITYPFESVADVGIAKLPAAVKAEFEAWAAENGAVKKAYESAK